MATLSSLSVSEAAALLTQVYTRQQLRQFLSMDRARQLQELGLIIDRDKRLQAWFSLLSPASYDLTSEINPHYNCIAWAVDKMDAWWWPSAYWPAGVPTNEDIPSFVEAYKTEGYELCSTSEIEVGYQKVAIYAKGKTPTHAAKLLPDGKWSSKLGKWEDMSHSRDALCGNAPNEYGTIVAYMRKLIAPPPASSEPTQSQNVRVQLPVSKLMTLLLLLAICCFGVGLFCR